MKEWLDTLDKLASISGFILAFIVYRKSTKKEYKKKRKSDAPAQRNVATNQTEAQPERDGLLNKKYHLLNKMSKLQIALNLVLAFIAVRFFMKTDFSNMVMLDVVLLVTIIVWLAAMAHFVFNKLRGKK